MKFIGSVFLCFWVSLLAAQSDCANHQLRQHMTDPAYWKALELTEEQLLNYAHTLRINSDSMLTIPVVFHIMHTGEPIGTGTNITDNRVLNTLHSTNLAWNDKAGRGADMGFQFCLAQTDPNGNPTNGIVRIDASTVPQYDSFGVAFIFQQGASESELKQLSNWPHDRYYNIWVVNKLGGGFGGFAYLPSGSNFDNDGMMITANMVKPSLGLLAHELGHSLGLYHTFQGSSNNGCPANDNCDVQGDYVCDTPPHRSNDCINSPCTSGNVTNSSWNFMSYCYLSRFLFTEGQKIRARSKAFTTSRLALLSSPVCNYVCTDTTELQAITCSADSTGTFSDTLQAVSGCDSIVRTTYTLVTVPSADFSYVFSESLTVDFSLPAATDSGTTIHWQFGDGSSSIEAQPQHTYTAPGNYEVILTLSNVCGIDTAVQIISIIPTGIRDAKVDRFKLYPNPMSGVFTLEWFGNHMITGEIRIINMLGQTVANYTRMPGPKQEIRLPSGLATGTYLLQVLTAEYRAKTIRLILE